MQSILNPEGIIVLKNVITTDSCAQSIVFEDIFSVSLTYGDLHVFFVLLYFELRKCTFYQSQNFLSPMDKEINLKLSKDKIKVQKLQEKVNIVVSKVLSFRNSNKKKRKKTHIPIFCVKQ
jgi:hypothetical protein